MTSRRPACATWTRKSGCRPTTKRASSALWRHARKTAREFSASEHPICYNVRLNLTADPQKMVPIEKPANYDPKQHELLARCIEAGYLKAIGKIIGLYKMPGSQKRECNNRQFSFVSMSIPGAQTAWAEASFEEREKIYQQYRDYTHGTALVSEVGRACSCKRCGTKWPSMVSARMNGRTTTTGRGTSTSAPQDA